MDNSAISTQENSSKASWWSAVQAASGLKEAAYIRLEAIASRNKKLLGAPGLTTRSKKLLGAPGIATNGAIGRYS